MKAPGLSRRLCCLTLDDPRAVALGGEPVRIGGEVCGRVTSGGFGYTVGASIAYAYLPVEIATPGTEVEVNMFGEWVPGVVTPSCDPKSALVDPESLAAPGVGAPTGGDVRHARSAEATSPSAAISLRAVGPRPVRRVIRVRSARNTSRAYSTATPDAV